MNRPRELRKLALAAALGLSALAARPAAGHDLWLELSDATPAPGSAVTVEVRVGSSFPGETLPHRPASTARFAVVGAAGEQPVTGLALGPAAGAFRVDRGGDLAVVLRSRETAIELPADHFESYLAEEGLEEVSERREVAGASARPGRELYSRSVKALLRTGAGSPETPVHTRPTGLDLELIPTVSPYELTVGDALEVVLLWHGLPLAGALVEAVRREDPGSLYARRTDPRGLARFPLSAPGLWRLTVVHMEQADGRAADWRSVWSALTFTLDD